MFHKNYYAFGNCVSLHYITVKHLAGELWFEAVFLSYEIFKMMQILQFGA
jgi:hypothetical protein